VLGNNNRPTAYFDSVERLNTIGLPKELEGVHADQFQRQGSYSHSTLQLWIKFLRLDLWHSTNIQVFKRNHKDKAKDQLIKEPAEMRQQAEAVKRLETGRKWAEEEI